MKIKPLFDRILAEVEERENKTSLGIELLENDMVKKAKIIAVGGKTEPIFKVGDYIYFEENFAVKIKIDQKEYVLLRQFDALAYEEKTHEKEL